MARSPRGGAVLSALALLVFLAGCAEDRYSRAPELEAPYWDLTFDEGVDRFNRDVGTFFSDIGTGVVETAKFISPFKPPKPINATRVEVVRQLEPLGSSQEPSASAQYMTISLISGHSVMIDSDGRKYPNDLGTGPADRLKALLDSREWEKGTQPIGVPRRGGNEPIRYYRMTVYLGDAPHKKDATWLAPSTAPLPEPLEIASDLFTAQHRRAHPLSDRINLLEKPLLFGQ